MKTRETFINCTLLSRANVLRNILCGLLVLSQKSEKNTFCLEMKTNLLEGFDDRRVFCCAVILNDRDIKLHRTDVGKYSFVNRTSKSFLASSPVN